MLDSPSRSERQRAVAHAAGGAQRCECSRGGGNEDAENNLPSRGITCFHGSPPSLGLVGLSLADAVGGQRRALLVGLRLTVDDLRLRLHQMVGLKHTLILEGSRRELLIGRTRILRTEADVHTGNALVQVAHEVGNRGRGRSLDRGVERAQAVELHRLSLRIQLPHARHDVLQHQHLVGSQLAVLSQVACESLQRDGFLRLSLRIELSVSLRSRITAGRFFCYNF